MNQATFGLRRFMLSRFLGTLSDQFLMFAVPLAIFQSTGSVVYSGLAFVIEWLPRIVFFPLGGFIADRMKPRLLFFGVEVGRAAVLLMASGLIATGAASTFAALSTTMGLLSVAYILNFVGTEAMLPRNLAPADLPKAHSMLQGVDQVTQVAGPALAAALSVWVGHDALLLVGAALFGLSSLNLLGLNTAAVATASGLSLRALGESNVQAIRVLVRNKVLFLLSGLTWVVNLIYGSALVLSAPIVVKYFMRPESHFGALQTAAAITAIGVFWFVPRFVRRFGLGVLGAGSFWAMIAAGLVLAFSNRYEVYLAGYAALMALDGVFSVYIRTVRSQIIPQEHLGKTTGFIGLMNMCSIPLSGLVVVLLSPTHTPFEILNFMFAAALVLGAALVLVGKLAFRYSTLLPSVSLPATPGSSLAQAS